MCSRVGTVTDLVSDKRTSIAVLAKAPLPGFAKTRLAPAFGAVGAARIHRELTLKTLRTVCCAGLGPVGIWCTPDPQQRFFRALTRSSHSGTLMTFCPQGDGDLGQRMRRVFANAGGPLLLIGTDCPVLNIVHLKSAAKALHDGNDAVFIPAEDGGYALVGLNRSIPQIFEQIDWGSEHVMAQTREIMGRLGVRWVELETLWDVDRPEDVARWRDASRTRAVSPVSAGETSAKPKTTKEQGGRGDNVLGAVACGDRPRMK
jgi:uncharacterized protein